MVRKESNPIQWHVRNLIFRQHSKSAPINTVRAPNGAPIYRIERGGEVTYHGPGQLVVYPLLDLQRHPYKKDLHWYLRCIEEVVIKTLEEYGIHGERDEINTGELQFYSICI